MIIFKISILVDLQSWICLLRMILPRQPLIPATKTSRLYFKRYN